MRNKIPFVVLIVASVILIVWLWRGDESARENDQATESPTHGPGQRAPRPGPAEGDTAQDHESPGGSMLARWLGGKQPRATRVSRITGRVLDADTHEPVPYVDVTFIGASRESTANSGDDGEYTIDLSPGRYTVRAIGEQVFARSPPAVSLAGLDEPVILDVYVERLALVRGKVRFSSGAPAAHAEVWLRKDSHPAAVHMNGVLADANGRFEIRVPSGDLELRASKGGLHGFVQLRLGESLSPAADLVIVLEDSTSVSGVVLDPNGRRVAQAMVHASVRIPRHGLHERTPTMTDEEGRFSIEGLRPGEMVMLAEAAGYAESTLLRLRMSPGQKQRNVVLAVRTPQVLAGRVVSSDGTPLDGVLVHRLRGPINLRRHSTFTNDDGTFELSPVGGGPHELLAIKEGYLPARTRGVMVADGVTLKLRPASGVRGTVTTASGAPVQSFVVRVTRVGSGKRKTVTAQFFSRDGSFEVTELEPGTHDVVVDVDSHRQGKHRVEVPAGGFADASIVTGA